MSQTSRSRARKSDLGHHDNGSTRPVQVGGPGVDPAGDPTQGHADVEQRIRERAYALYLERGLADGCALDDWLQAEAQYR
jgi:hypothetical protein